jgi:hypothetical protein
LKRIWFTYSRCKYSNQEFNKGTATDFDGKFSLKGLPSGSTVVFTYIGFKDFEYKVTGNNSGLNVSLVGDAKSLDEVVVWLW